MFVVRVFAFIALASLACGAPTKLGIAFESGAFTKRNTLPTLTLPYGTWRASNYNLLSDM